MKKVKKQAYFNLLLWILILVLINYVASQAFTRIDLTSEKRYTLSDETKKILNELDDVVYVQIYLEGDLNAGFKRLRNSAKEMLDEFKVYAGDNIEYEFINPFKDRDEKARAEITNQLSQKGLIPTNLQEKDSDGQTSQKIIFPGAIFTYRGNEVSIDLLENDLVNTAEQNLNNSIEDIEFEFVRGITELQRGTRPKVGIIEGHGELNEMHMASALDALTEYYDVEIVRLDSQLNSLRERVEIDSLNSKIKNRYETIIIAGPDSSFNKFDKFIIDQFIMHGGKVLWLIEGTTADMDSLSTKGSFMALVNEHNLTDQLFKYGARINPDLIEDIQCAVIPIMSSVAGSQSNFVPTPWLFFPLITPSNNHPITRNMDMIKTEFVSTIDTVGENRDVKKTVLLKTSQYTKVINVPVRIGLDIVGREPDKSQFVKPYQNIAVLLEGEFESIFKNRLEPIIRDNKLFEFKEKSVPTKMIVVADGDIIKNPIVRRGDRYVPMPLGSDRWFPDQLFYGGNMEFILNAVNYLCDDQGMMSVRSRELKIRLMDRTKMKEGKTKWQMVNILIPVLVIVIFGLIITFIRKRRYSRIK